MQVSTLSGIYHDGAYDLGKFKLKIKAPKIIKSAVKAVAKNPINTAIKYAAPISMAKTLVKKVPGANIVKKAVKTVTKNPVFKTAMDIVPFTPAAPLLNQFNAAKKIVKTVSDIADTYNAAPGVAPEDVYNNNSDVTPSAIDEMNNSLISDSDQAQQNLSLTQLQPDMSVVSPVEFPIVNDETPPPDANVDMSGDMNDKAYVKKVQNALIKKGYKLSADGIYGNQSKAALTDFQKKNKLKVSGTMDADSEKALGISDGLWTSIKKVIVPDSVTDALTLYNPVTAPYAVANKITEQVTGKSLVTRAIQTAEPTYTPEKGLPSLFSTKTKIIAGIILVIIILIIIRKVIK